MLPIIKKTRRKAFFQCEKCKGNTEVIDSRRYKYSNKPAMRRRRECLKCGFRVFTIESSEYEDNLKLARKAEYQRAKFIHLLRTMIKFMGLSKDQL